MFIYIQSSEPAVGFSSRTEKLQDEHLSLLKKVNNTKLSRRIAVPTKPEDVKNTLREYQLPIQLFGERPEDRRDRLRTYLAEQTLGSVDDIYDEDDVNKG